MWVQACTRGSRSSQALGKDCFGPKRPGPKEEKDVDTSWQLSALQPGRTVLSFHCPRLGGQRCSLCSGPEKTAFARKHRQDLQSSWPAIGVPAKLCSALSAPHADCQHRYHAHQRHLLFHMLEMSSLASAWPAAPQTSCQGPTSPQWGTMARLSLSTVCVQDLSWCQWDAGGEQASPLLDSFIGQKPCSGSS